MITALEQTDHACLAPMKFLQSDLMGWTLLRRGNYIQEERFVLTDTGEIGVAFVPRQIQEAVTGSTFQA